MEKGRTVAKSRTVGRAPAGLRDCGHGRTQGLVAPAGLRTLGSEKGRPAGACPATRQLAKKRTTETRSATFEIAIPHPALHGIKRPRYRKGSRCGKGPCCGKEPRCGSPLQGFGIMGTDEPRVWSPLQGYAPWALERVALWQRAALRVAPAGLRDCGYGRTQGLLALAGLRTLGSGKGRPAGAYPAASGQLAKERTTEIVMPHLTQHSIERAALGGAFIRPSGLPRRSRKPL